MIEITHIKWSFRGKKCIGIAEHKLQNGPNKISITAADKEDKPYFPQPFTITKEELSERYQLTTIQKSGLQGYFIPLEDIKFD